MIVTNIGLPVPKPGRHGGDVDRAIAERILVF